MLNFFYPFGDDFVSIKDHEGKFSEEKYVEKLISLCKIFEMYICMYMYMYGIYNSKNEMCDIRRVVYILMFTMCVYFSISS